MLLGVRQRVTSGADRGAGGDRPLPGGRSLLHSVSAGLGCRSYGRVVGVGDRLDDGEAEAGPVAMWALWRPGGSAH